MSLEDIAKDLKNNPPVRLMSVADADPVKYKQFFEHQCAYHRKDKHVTGAIGGAITCQYTSTSLGTVVKIRCACGKEEDVTDYHAW